MWSRRKNIEKRTEMKNRLLTFLVAMACCMAVEAQTTKQQQVSEIRKIYAEAKQQIAENGKDGKAPLDVKITLSNPSEVDEDFVIDDDTELTFYFNKYRVNTSLDYPDASSCYFITENWTSHGHLRYREILFDPNEGYLLFCYMRGETDAGFVVETRYYYDGTGRLVDQKHKVGGQDAGPGTHTWNDETTEKALATDYLRIFDMLMNAKGGNISERARKGMTASKADRMTMIRNTYTKAKQKIDVDSKGEYSRNMQIVIHDQSWGPPSTADLRFYFEPQQRGDASYNHCYCISEHRHHNNMGPDRYAEYLFAPSSHDLIFSYCRAVEEGEKSEWRYYYDANGNCIEVITNAADNDKGRADKLAASRYLDVFNAMANSPR